MCTDGLLIIGAGGHAKVVMDAIYCSRTPDFFLQLADDNVSLAGKKLLGATISAPVIQSISSGRKFHVAIGNNLIREQVASNCIQSAMIYETVIHPRSICAMSAQINLGCFIAAGATIAPDVEISKGSIVNHGAVVDHDCHLASFCHVAPNATLGGGVKLGKRVLIGAGANILPGLTIADDCIIGSGAVVLRSIPEAGTYVGIPALKIKQDRK